MHIIFTRCIYVLTTTLFNRAVLFGSWYKLSVLKCEGWIALHDIYRLMTFF